MGGLNSKDFSVLGGVSLKGVTKGMFRAFDSRVGGFSENQVDMKTKKGVVSRARYSTDLYR